MKRLVTLMLAAGLLLGGASVSTASAIELKAGGQWDFFFGWSDARTNDTKVEDRFKAAQRIRPEFKFIADENLKGVLQFEIGDGDFGKGSWALGNDGKEVKVRYGYVDWTVPGADTKVRMGMQNFTLPNFTGNRLVAGGGAMDVAGISLSQQFCDNFGMGFTWFRPYNADTTTAHDAIDVFALVFNTKGDGWKVSPWIMTAAIGKEVGNAWVDANGNYSLPSNTLGRMARGLVPASSGAAWLTHDDSGKGWWLGLSGELSMFDPFKVALDFAYGSVDLGEYVGTDGMYDAKRKGWTIDLLATYKFDYVTPGLQFWYGSGDDANPANGSERLPYFDQDVANVAPFFGDTGYYHTNSKFRQEGFDGTWGLQLRFDDINYGVKGLKHELRAAYVAGTNNRALVQNGYVAADKSNCEQTTYMTKDDHMWVFNLNTRYQIYKNLSANLLLAYMKYDWDNDVWGTKRDTLDKQWLAAVHMQYKF